MISHSVMTHEGWWGILFYKFDHNLQEKKNTNLRFKKLNPNVHILLQSLTNDVSQTNSPNIKT
jgi:hypothetical protein